MSMLSSTPRSSLILFLALLALVLSVGAQPDERPNLLFIITDQQRFDAMSNAGNTVVDTPNMARIAAEGVMFQNAYTANPVCVPARASFLTGLTPVNVRVEGNGDYESEDVPDVPTFDSVLVEHGYAAEYYGKWHTPYQFAEVYDNPVKAVGAPGSRTKGLNQIKAYHEYLLSKGVDPKPPIEGQLFSERNQRPYVPIALDRHADHVGHEVDAKMALKARQANQYGRIDLPPHVSYAAFTAEETMAAIDRLKDGPFTLTCSFDPPHPPMIVQEPYYSMYPPEDIPLPVSMGDPMTDSPYAQQAQTEDQQPYRDPTQIRNMRSIYYGMIREVDDWIGAILGKLEEHGILGNTLIVFTSDHGEMLGDHGMHSKVIFYEGSVHIPLLMRFPKAIKPGVVVKEPVSGLDVFATILDYLEMPIPKNNGISLRPFIEGNPIEHDVVSYSVGRDRPNYMIRRGDLKLMMAQNTASKSINALYDLEADPHEMRNLIAAPVDPQKNRAQAEDMKAKLVDWMRRHEPHKADDLLQVPL